MDFDKKYSKEEMLSMTYNEIFFFKRYVEDMVAKKSATLSKEDVKIVEQANEYLFELKEFPYAYHHNPHFFKMGEEKESEIKFDELRNKQEVIRKGREIWFKLFDSLPEHVKENYSNLLEVSISSLSKR